jgi:hypothetical protein
VKFRIGGKLTDAQVAAGFLVGTIYGAFERFHGKRRSVASPNYERACGKGRDDEPPHTDRRRSSRPRTAPAQIRDHAIEDERHARGHWADLQDEFEKLPAAVQARAHRASSRCVENRYVDQWHLRALALIKDTAFNQSRGTGGPCSVACPVLSGVATTGEPIDRPSRTIPRGFRPFRTIHRKLCRW